ncbi:YceI family protein [Leptospira langatensis]|uniref:YceI family protein n=1 Tax=Leptospira langatensis TaxID=2484983 RepID=A0A5F1ZY54_9LEPT|nr:YceI family protein [Leptospira langatensis]TGK04138.1 YceI family protein [Leptospira langatensis]TGL43618.1 YceI family protein [Leptospira langatensis]
MIRILISILFFAYTSIIPVYSEELKLVDPKVEFTVIHPFKTVIGKCTGVNASPTTLTANTNGVQIPKSVKIDIPVKEIRSGDENRDEHIMEALGYPTYSTISFVSTGISLTKDGDWSIAGNLTINGKTRPVKSVAKIHKDDHETSISGKFSVLMSDFEVEAPSLLFAKAKDEVSIEYKFILKP